MTVKRGKIHEYLGMTLDFSEESKFIVSMEEYIDGICSGFPEDEWSVKTRDDIPKLNKKEPSYSTMSPHKLYVWHNVADPTCKWLYHS